MSSTVPTVCCMNTPFSITSSFSAYKGANVTADTARTLVQNLQPTGRIQRIYRKYKMLHIMNQDNSHYGKPAEGIHHLDTWIALEHLFHHHPFLFILCFKIHKCKDKSFTKKKTLPSKCLSPFIPICPHPSARFEKEITKSKKHPAKSSFSSRISVSLPPNRHNRTSWL